MLLTKLITLAVAGVLQVHGQSEWDGEAEFIPPSILIPVFVRNKEHALPYFFGGLERQNYPKSRIRLWFVTDHNADNSLEVIKAWKEAWEMEYMDIKIEIRDPRKGHWNDAQTELSWSPNRYDHILKLRQQALNHARNMLVDYLFMIDADNILVQPSLLRKLVLRDKPIVGPMLETGVPFSNFWSNQNTETGYYERGNDYYDIRYYEQEFLNVHKVPMLHSCYLIDMNRRKSQLIQYWPRIGKYSDELPYWPMDDIIYFTGMAKLNKIDLWVDNTMAAGWFPYPVQSGELPDEVAMFNHMLMEMNTLPPVGWDMIPQASAATPPVWPVQTKHGLSEIFVINLERRIDRKERMDFCMRIQGIKYTLVAAVDGKSLTQEDIDNLGIRQLPGFSDPHKPRTITRGEVGCFLSHFYLWQKMVPGEIYLVLEDDVRFGPDFVVDLRRVLREAKAIDKWDLIYVGRKRGPGADNDVEVMVTENISNVTYSFWTLGYIITGEAARVLVDEKPLEKLIPVDEYLPIMYGAHKIDSYTKAFKNKNLKAFSANPVLVQPTHYTGQENYFTDTEPSTDDDILQYENNQVNDANFKEDL